MKNCVFCQIAGNPSSENQRIIYTDSKYLGMLVAQPESNGHFIVFPKKHVAEMSELSDPGEFFELVVRLAESVAVELGAKAYVIKLNNNIYKLENDPLHVGHIHTHVIPRFVQDRNKEKPVAVDVLYFQKLLCLLTNKC